VQQPMVYPGMPGMGWTSYRLDPAEFDDAANTWLAPLVGPNEESVLLHGYPPATVCEWAAEVGVDLIVIAVTRRMVERVFLGSFANYMTHHAPCPVLLVRPTVEAQGEAARQPAS
jgi:nucleotide-binding universal stress UspA family protein